MDDQKEKSKRDRTYHPYTNEEPNAKAGQDQAFPGQTRKTAQTLGKRKRFRGFPKKDGDNAKRYDLVKLKAEFDDSPVSEWDAFCGLRGYNPNLYQGIPWRRWVREKKFRDAWQSVKGELEAEGMQIGPRLLLRQVRAVRQIPETASAMLAILQHAVRIHTIEARHDQNLIEAAQQSKSAFPSAQLRFSAGSQDLVFLASALKQTGELLYKSLGIDHSNGVSVAKWLGLVETELGQMEGGSDPADQGSIVSVEVLGGASIREALAEAMEKYLDKPGTHDALEAGQRPEGMDASDTSEPDTPEEGVLLEEGP